MSMQKRPRVGVGGQAARCGGDPGRALTDVGVLQQAADPSLPLQLLVIWAETSRSRSLPRPGPLTPVPDQPPSPELAAGTRPLGRPAPGGGLCPGGGRGLGVTVLPHPQPRGRTRHSPARNETLHTDRCRRVLKADGGCESKNGGKHVCADQRASNAWLPLTAAGPHAGSTQPRRAGRGGPRAEDSQAVLCTHMCTCTHVTVRVCCPQAGQHTRPPTSGGQLLGVDDLGGVLVAGAELDAASDDRESPPGTTRAETEGGESPDAQPREPAVGRERGGVPPQQLCLFSAPAPAQGLLAAGEGPPTQVLLVSSTRGAQGAQRVSPGWKSLWPHGTPRGGGEAAG